MNVGILLLLLILAYAGWIISRKIKKIRSGQFCDCGHCSRGCGNGACISDGKSITGGGYNKEQLL